MLGVIYFICYVCLWGETNVIYSVCKLSWAQWQVTQQLKHSMALGISRLFAGDTGYLYLRLDIWCSELFPDEMLIP